ncbi:hypothetical protein F5Y18DRAFT_377396 [Xylariaceae sp. FL1019]|nr:hypothetical protein F5Y18DRAFT_377396 [Xylariaceae sp. FL1019]
MENSDIIEITNIPTFSELGKYLTACCPTAVRPSDRKVHIELSCEICHTTALALPKWVKAKEEKREDSPRDAPEVQPKDCIDKQSEPPTAEQVGVQTEEQMAARNEDEPQTSPRAQSEFPVEDRADAPVEQPTTSDNQESSSTTTDDSADGAKYIAVLPCDHFFGFTCWGKWNKSAIEDGNAPVCPKCRFGMRHPGCGHVIFARALPPTIRTGVMDIPRLIPLARVHRWRNETDENDDDPFVDITPASRRDQADEWSRVRSIAPKCYVCRTIKRMDDLGRPTGPQDLTDHILQQLAEPVESDYSDAW